MAKRLIYVCDVLTITLTMPSDEHTVTIMMLDKHPPAVKHDPAVVRADMKIRYHGQR